MDNKNFFDKAIRLKSPAIKGMASKVNLAYKTDSDDRYTESRNQLHNTELVDTGWHVLYKSTDYADTDQYGYKSVALMNTNTKEVHIASAGTKINKDDLVDNVKVFVVIPQIR
jgi:hypothetical protein